MNLHELKQQSRKRVSSPFTGMEYIIQRMDQLEFGRAQLTGIMSAEESPAHEKTLSRAVAEKMSRTLDEIEQVLRRSVLEPIIFFGPETETPENQAHISWIAPDQAWLYSEALKLSGMDEASQKALQEFLKNGHGSETSSSLEEPAASSQANS
jgi:hypothetical protein